MTNDKFRALCEQVLIPRLGDLLHRQLVELEQTLEIVASELVRIGDRLDHIAADLDAAHDEDR
jgi:hypothetical protein